MGLDYRYLLYFRRQNLWDVLQGIAAISQPSQLPSLIVFPDHMLTLSLKGWGKKERLINPNDPEFGFMTAIYFPADEAITEYLHRVSPEHFDSMSKESPLGLPVGYIYLTVYNDLSVFEDKDWDPDLVMMEFSTPGTRMSLLFSESESIRKRFVSLLETYQGVCGVLDLESEARVIWLKGKRLDLRIPDAWMSPDEIEEILNDLECQAD